MTLHPEILKKKGKKQFAVLPYEEFVALQEWLRHGRRVGIAKGQTRRSKKTLGPSARGKAAVRPRVVTQ
jgi:hypothetical protein